MAENPGSQILVVDDDLAVRELLAEGLGSLGHEVELAGDAGKARELFGDGGRYPLVLCDIEMPGETGVELLHHLKTTDPDCDVVMVTGVVDVEVALGTIRKGASDYLTKPFSFEEVRWTVDRVLEKRQLVRENREYQQQLEVKVEERTRELLSSHEKIKALNRDLEIAYDATLEALVTALDYRDNETQGHSLRVVYFTELIAKKMRVGGSELTDIRRGAMLHDVGKIGVPDSILRKPGPLDEGEWEIMRQHPELGYRMLEGIQFLAEASRIVLTHQERWDGDGYPLKLRGTDIPLGSRIFAVADTFDAMTSDRPYRKALSHDVARQEMIDHRGTQFDPAVVDAFISVEKKTWLKVRERVHEEVKSRATSRLPETLWAKVAQGGGKAG
jgi:putative nucleotidyltransferase with HDIG domain